MIAITHAAASAAILAACDAGTFAQGNGTDAPMTGAIKADGGE